MTAYNIRLATQADIPQITSVSASAEAKFRTIPQLDSVFAHLGQAEKSFMKVKFQQSLQKGRIFLAEHDNSPVGFLGAYQMDTALYVAEISVSNEHNGKGIGSMLLDTAFQWARERALECKEEEARVSLTTYAEIPWNGPWYQKRGFEQVDAEVIGPLHVEKMRYDRDVRDLNRPGYTRCCMLWREKLKLVQ